MLQQTQVATVIHYYERFVRRFPDVLTLANSSEQDVLRAWEGLGYYRRARQMHAAARVIVDRHDGRFPTDFADVLALPGIGRYTAGAILSIATEQAFPILEGNTVRLHARLIGLDENPADRSSQKTLWDFAEQLVTRTRPGELNQALMELGSQVCTPTKPRCHECPVRSHCEAFALGRQHELPRKGNRLAYADRFETALVVECDGAYLMRQCRGAERWAGLWDFPRLSFAEPRTPAALDEHFEELTGVDVTLQQPFWSTRHAVTRFRIRLACYHVNTDDIARESMRIAAGFSWQPAEAVKKLPLNVTGRQIAQRVRSSRV